MKKEILFKVFSILATLLIPMFALASDADLVADFRLENSLADSMEVATRLVELGETTFQTDTVDGVNKTVLNFPAGGGVALESASNLFSYEIYTIVLLFQFENTGSWRRLIDFKNRSSDTGLYAYGANLQFYNVSTGSGGSILPDTYIQVALTRDLSKNVNGYVNGNPEINFVDNSDSAVIDSSDILSFFRDDLLVKNEHSAGSVARIRIYNRALTRQEIGLLDRLPGQSGNRPIITSELHISTIKNEPLTYSIEATNSPISFSATNLPQWATLDNETGIISATPTQVGTSEIFISAINSAGTGSVKLILTVISLEEQSVGFSSSNYSFFENSISPSVFIVRTGKIDSNIEVDCSTIDGTATSDSDYEAINKKIVFGPGETYKIIPLTIVDDKNSESTESFSITLQNSNSGHYIIEPNPVNIEIFNNSCTAIDSGYTQSDLDSAKQNGRQECIDDPVSCGIVTSDGYTQADLDTEYQKGYDAGSSDCSNGSSEPATDSDYQTGYDQGYIDGQATCEDEAECTQVVTYAKIPDADCWVMFSTPCDVPEGWEILYEEPSNMCASSENTDNCSTFDIFSNTLHVPCFNFNGGSTMYWLDWELTGSEPVTLELKDLGEN